MFSSDSILTLKESISEKRAKKGPIDLQILLTTSCNAGCIFCPMNAVPELAKEKFAPRWKDAPKHFPFGIFDRLVDELYHLDSVKRIHLTGGEPLVHPRAMAMIFELRRTFAEAELCLVTNGINLKEYAGFLVRIGLDRISISINSGTEESFVAHNPGLGSKDFAMIWEGLELARKERDIASAKKPYLSITSVLTKYNFKELPKLFELVVKYGGDALTYIPLMDFPFAGKLVEDCRVKEEEFREFLLELRRLEEEAKRVGIYVGFCGEEEFFGLLRSGDLYERIPCYCGYTFAIVWPSGDVRLCCNCEDVIGNLREQGFSRIWFSERANFIRERMYKIRELGAPESCDCEECSYLYENKRFWELLGS